MKEKVLFLITIICLCYCNQADKNLSADKNKNKGDLIQKENSNGQTNCNDSFICYKAKPSQIRMYWKKDGQVIRTFSKLKEIEPGLIFAMNGGMFTPAYAPVGLYVEEGNQLKPLKKINNPKVNFGIQPQGVFLIRDQTAEVVTIEEYKAQGIRFATQSAPMVVIDSVINPNLPTGNSRTVRNGVGILPDGKVLMACSKYFVTFRQFAKFFRDMGCKNALYLDGGISSTTEGGGFPLNSGYGVLIAVVK
jgi:uncharacterized protein YigE (DUF2233 family)